VGEDIMKATKEWKGLRVTVKLTIKNRQATAEIVPFDFSCSPSSEGASSGPQKGEAHQARRLIFGYKKWARSNTTESLVLIEYLMVSYIRQWRLLCLFYSRYWWCICYGFHWWSHMALL